MIYEFSWLLYFVKVNYVFVVYDFSLFMLYNAITHTLYKYFSLTHLSLLYHLHLHNKTEVSFYLKTLHPLLISFVICALLFLVFVLIIILICYIYNSAYYHSYMLYM
ncbi:hypothetical protein Leryth_019531 [Lithospermum erythrorhizon]|nr:hypothetical protein Leryth_019531 [Lithospermum erythrorhizon]